MVSQHVGQFAGFAEQAPAGDVACCLGHTRIVQMLARSIASGRRGLGFVRPFLAACRRATRPRRLQGDSCMKIQVLRNHWWWPSGLMLSQLLHSLKGHRDRGAGAADPRLCAVAHPRRRAGARFRQIDARGRVRREHGPKGEIHDVPWREANRCSAWTCTPNNRQLGDGLRPDELTRDLTRRARPDEGGASSSTRRGRSTARPTTDKPYVTFRHNGWTSAWTATT